MSARVAALTLAPVKGLRATGVDEIDLRTSGAAGDRRLVVVDPGLRWLETRRTPQLATVEARWRDPETLELRLPAGVTVVERVVPAERATTRLYGGRPARGRLVDGALAAALGDHLGRRVRLLALDPDEAGTDDHPVTVMSLASLADLGRALGDEGLDGRRFRMTITVEGPDAWEERGWAGATLAVGDAALEVVGPVPRCVVTTRSPATGERDHPVLRALAGLHGRDAVEFGVWCRVLRPGVVRVGDELIYKS